MTTCFSLVYEVLVLHQLWLATAPHLPLPPTTAPMDLTTRPDQLAGGGGGWGTAVQVGALFAYCIVSLYVLIRTGFFSPKPLRAAPSRRATALLPIAGGIFIVYLVLQVIALQVGLSTGFFSPRVIGLPDREARPAMSVPATAAASSLPADATRADAMTVAEAPPATATASPSSPFPTPPAPPPSPSATAAAGASTRNSGPSPNEKMRFDSAMTAAEFITILLALMLCPIFFARGIAGIGLDPRQLGWGVLLGLGAYAVLLPWLLSGEIVLPLIYEQFHHQMSVHETLRDIQESPSFDVKLIFAILAGVAAPISEEVFFRGFLQTGLIQRGWGFLIEFPFPPKEPPSPPPPPPPPGSPAALGGYGPSALQRWVAIVLVSAFFAYVHNPDHFPIIFLLAIGLGYTYERTGSLWASITMHAAFNWFALVPLLWGAGGPPAGG